MRSVSGSRQLDPLHTSVHLTLTTQIMATERNDSQIGHALAQGPLMTDIVAASSTNSGWNPKVPRPVEQEKPANNKLEMERLPDGDQEWSDRLLRGNEGCRDSSAVDEDQPVLRRPVCDVAVVKGPAVLQGPAASNHAGQHKSVSFQHHLLPRSTASQVWSHL